jgi:hypothetical protein
MPIKHRRCGAAMLRLVMTKLAIIQAEAQRLVRRLRPERLGARAEELRQLCAARWPELRGPAPQAPLARAVWEARPPLAELFAELCATGDPRLVIALGRLSAAQGLAAMALAELARGDANEARSAYEAMMPFRSPGSRAAYSAAVSAKLSGEKRVRPQWHRHSSHPAIEKAVAAIRDETGRDDLNALVAAIEFLARVQSGGIACGDDATAGRLLQVLRDLGVEFRGFDRHGLRYVLRATERKQIPLRDLR